jgi:hypothetical protein
MKTKLVFALVVLSLARGALFAAAPAPANTQVEVIFQNPEKFTDLKESELGSEKERDNYVQLFKEHLQEVAPRYLAEGQKLTVTFTDIDLAGDFEPWRGPRFSDIRIVKSIYPPRAELSFKLTDATGAVIKEGQRSLRDLNFEWGMSNYFDNDSIRYEKVMLDNWLKQEFPREKKKK